MADHNRQRLLVDTDAFCKLGVAGLLTDAIGVLGVTVENCGRLAALPYPESTEKMSILNG